MSDSAHQSPMGSSSRRWKSRRSKNDGSASNSRPVVSGDVMSRARAGSPSAPYVPPTIEAGDDIVVTTTATPTVASEESSPSFPPGNFVTQPPKPKQGLTGKISTLFRRESSRERGERTASASASPPRTRHHVETSVASDGKGSVVNSGSQGRARSASVSPKRKKGSGTTKSAAALSSSVRNSSSPGKRNAHSSSRSTNKGKSKSLAVMGAAAAAAIEKGAERPLGMGQNNEDRRRRRLGYENNEDIEQQEEDGTGESVGVASLQSRGSHKQRIFYSSHNDESSDSYESRVSGKRSKNLNAQGSVGSGTNHISNSMSGMSSTAGERTILRYRGFSTSIKSLFLDESLVCASMGCFGLILSNRTEYLLQIRNERRGTISPRRHQNLPERKKLPSRIVAYGLLLTILLMFSTFVIWGFGSNGLTQSYYSGYDYNDDGAQDDAYAAWDDYLQNNDDQNAAAADDDNANNDDANNWWNWYNDDANVNNNNNYDNNNYNNNNYNNNNYDNNNYNNNNYNNNNYNNYNNYNNDDDGNGNGNNWNNDDGVNDDENNDDGNNNNQNQDDDGNNDDYYNQNDDAAANGDDGGRQRHLYKHVVVPVDGNALYSSRRPHRVNGILKLRDMQENLWDPALRLFQAEWNREQEQKETKDATQNRQHRRNQEYYYDYDNGYATDDGVVTSTNYGSDGNENYDGNQEVQENSMESRAVTKRQRDLAGNIRIALLFSFLLFLGILGRRRRMRTRFYLVRARAQEDHLYFASTEAGTTRRLQIEDSREDQYEGACSHTLCGCYPVDEVPVVEQDSQEEVEVRDSGIFKRKKKPLNEDIVARGFNCLMGTCCGLICKCWFQCLSVCALAQEAREIRLLVPPRYQRIDFITHQPFHEYQKDVNDLRRGWLGKTRRKAGITPHFNALSRLSRYIVVLFTLTVIVLVLTLIFNPRAAFSWQDAVVLIATFLQSFLVLFVVHWIFHKSDLSLDAVTKLFAAGFLIAVPSALFFEGLVINTVLFFAWSVYEICALISGEAFIDWVYQHWRLIWILGELFQAYVVAAVTEELCKYYTFRAVEHPDLVFLTGLQREQQDETAVEGGVVKYPFGSHQVQQYTRTAGNSFDNASQYSHRSNHSRKARRARRSSAESKSGSEILIEQTGTREDEFDEDEMDVRTYRQKAMAITTGMISVAVGLACAENFLYVFLFGGSNSFSDDEAAAAKAEQLSNDILEEWIVLFFRSIFPIHALAAAIQSINMIRKFVESDDQNGHRIGVGRIIFPAVILHGSFDAVLLGINVYIETAWDVYLEENEGYVKDDAEPYNVLLVNLIAWIGISLIMICGLLWYYRENRNQRLRLILLEEKEKAKHSAVAAASGADGNGTRSKRNRRHVTSGVATVSTATSGSTQSNWTGEDEEDEENEGIV